MSRVRFTCATFCGLLLIGLPGCGGHGSILTIAGLGDSYRYVRVRLTVDGQPLRAAHLRAVSVNTSSMGLPATGPVIHDAMYAWGTGEHTDEHGEATLKLFQFTPHLIEASPSPFDSLAEHGPWMWQIEADGRTLTDTSQEATGRIRPVLEVVDHDERAAASDKP